MNTTTRLKIDALEESHADAAFPMQLDERMYRYVPGKPCATVAALAERYRHLAAGSPDASEQWLNWCVFRLNDGALIGHLQATISVRDRVAWVAYILSPAYWRQGYATESLHWLLVYLQAAKSVDVARAQIDSRNTASQAVVEGLQFERKADLVENDIIDFVYEKRLRV